MIAVLLDQGLPRTAAGLLRQIGWDAQHVSERGMSQAEDVAIIEVARQEGRVYSGRRLPCLACGIGSARAFGFTDSHGRSQGGPGRLADRAGFRRCR